MHPDRQRFDCLGPVAVAGSLDRRANGIEHRHGIGAVNALSGDRPAAVDALGDVGVDHLARNRSRIGIPIRLDHEDRRHLPHGCEIQSFVCVADGERAFAEERHRDTALAAALERECRSHDHGYEIAEHRDEGEDTLSRRAEMHVAVATERGACRLAEEVAEHIGRARSSREVAGELTIEWRDDVIRPEGKTRARCHGFLAAPGVDRARDPALAVERHHPILEQSLQEDEPEEREPLGGADGGVLGAGFDRHQ